MKNEFKPKKTKSSTWVIDDFIFKSWLGSHANQISFGLRSEPTVKLLIFLALLDASQACTYADFKALFKEKKIIKGTIPNNTMRTAILSLGKTLDKLQHCFELNSSRGSFQLNRRAHKKIGQNYESYPVVLLLESPLAKPEHIACELIEKASLPFHALYFLENAARGWEIFSHNEAQIRIKYETETWERLGIQSSILSNQNNIISFVSLAPGEGLAEIELLKKILAGNSTKKIHYLAIDLSQRLLREHISLLKEALENEIKEDRLICVGVLGDIFSNLREAIYKAQAVLLQKGITKKESDFLPSSSSLLITYLGNCLGNCYPDQESKLFSIIYSTFQNRPLEIMVGVSVMRPKPDEYKRNWDFFLLQTPKHLLEISKLLLSSKPSSTELPSEFDLSIDKGNERCLSVNPEPYIARHGIEGQIYRFYYKLEYDLFLAENLGKTPSSLPKGTLILLYNIVKYNMEKLVHGIEAMGIFKIRYDDKYHQKIDTPNGEREYATFSVYVEQ